MKCFLIFFSIYVLFLTSCATDLISKEGTSNQASATHWIKSMKAKDYFDTQVQIDLADAITKGDTNKMQQLIAEGAEVNYVGRDDMRPLFWALAKQNIAGFKFLLDHGANPNVVTERPPLLNPLEIAVIMNDSRYLEELLKHGANPNVFVGNAPQTTGTPIFSAVLYNQTNNIALLLKYGADIECKLPNGTTPLHAAIYCGNYRAALFLYDAGANPLTKNTLGYSPIDTMKQFRDNAVLSRADEKAYRELLKEFREKGLF